MNSHTMDNKSSLLSKKIITQDELALKAQLLMDAIRANKEKTVKEILSSPGDDSYIDFFFYKTIYYDTRNGIFSLKNNKSNFFEHHPRTPLALAVYLGRLEMVSLLIQKGADVNLRGNYTPIEFALFYLKVLNDRDLLIKYQKIYDLLVQNGATLEENSEDNIEKLAEPFLPVIIHTMKIKK